MTRSLQAVGPFLRLALLQDRSLSIGAIAFFSSIPNPRRSTDRSGGGPV
jgi:hypothetical protein